MSSQGIMGTSMYHFIVLISMYKDSRRKFQKENVATCTKISILTSISWIYVFLLQLIECFGRKHI